MPLNGEHPAFRSDIELEDIRRFYFENTKRTLRIEDAKYLLELAQEHEINKSNGGLIALFKLLKYNFGEEENSNLFAS